MNVINREDLISVNGNMIRVDEVIAQLKHLPSNEVKTFFDTIQKTVPRQVRMGALRTVLKDQIDNPSILASLSDEVNYRLKWFEGFSEYQLENLLLILDNDYLEELFKEELWLSFLKIHGDLKFGEKEIGNLYNLSEVYISEQKEKLMEFNRYLDPIFYDYEGQVDGLLFNDFRNTLKQSSTLIELREIGVKYDVDVPRRIKKSELIDIIFDEMTISGTLTADIEERVKRMSIMTLQRFAKDNKIKASVELKKEDIIEYIIARAENEVEKTNVDLKVLKANDEPKHKTKGEIKKVEEVKNDLFRKEIDDLNCKISALMDMQERLFNEKNTKANEQKKAAIETQLEENLQEKTRLEEEIAVIVPVVKTEEEVSELKGLIQETIVNEDNVFIINEEAMENPLGYEPILEIDNNINFEEVPTEFVNDNSIEQENNQEQLDVSIMMDNIPVDEAQLGISSMMENMSVEDVENMILPDDIPYMMDDNSSIDSMDFSGMLDDLLVKEGMESPSASAEVLYFEEEIQAKKIEEIKDIQETQEDSLSSLFENLIFTEGEVMTSGKVAEKKKMEIEEDVTVPFAKVPSIEIDDSSEPTFDQMLVKGIEDNAINDLSDLDDPILTPIFDNTMLEETLFTSPSTLTEKKENILSKHFDEDAVEEEPFMEEFFSTSAYDELVEIEKQRSNKQFDIHLYDGVSEGDVVEKHEAGFNAPKFEAPNLVNVEIPANDFEAPDYQSNKGQDGTPIFESPTFETPIFEAPVFEAPNYASQQVDSHKSKTKQQLKAEVKRLEVGSKMEKKRRQSEEKSLMEALRSTSSLGRRRKKHPIRRFIFTMILFVGIIGLLFSVFMILAFLGIFGYTGALFDIYMIIKEGLRSFVINNLVDKYGLEFLRDLYNAVRDFLLNFR